MSTFISTIFSSLSDTERMYEKAISNYVQRDIDGKRMKLDFKVISMEARACTWGDCVRESIESTYEEKIADEMLRLENYKQRLEEAENSEYPSEIMKGIFQRNITRTEKRIEVLKDVEPDQDDLYGSLAPNMLMAIYVKCKYSIRFPEKKGVRQEYEDIFILTTDGRIAVGKVESSEEINEINIYHHK